MKLKIFLTSLALAMCVLSAYAAEPSVLDDGLYYANAEFYRANSSTRLNTSEQGETEVRYSVTNSENSSELYSVICGVYKSGILTEISSQTERLAAKENKIFRFEVTVPSNGEIKAYLTRNLNVRTPLRTLERLTGSSRDSFVTSIYIDGVKGDIDNLANVINAELEEGRALSDASIDIEVSEGAEYSLDGTQLTVTAENGAKRYYTIQTYTPAKSYLIDFEEFNPGESPQSVDPSSWDTTTGIISEEDGNKFILLLDDDGDGTTGAKTEARTKGIYVLGAPFEVSMKFKMNYIDGVTARDKINDLAYWGLNVRNGQNTLCNVSAVYTNSQYRFTYLENGSSKTSAVPINVGEWYDIKMKYYQEDGICYTDYSFTDENGETSQVLKVPSARTEKSMTLLYMTTSTLRKQVLSIDDVSMTELESGALKNYDGGSFAAPESFLTNDYTGSVKASFDFTADGNGGTYNLFTMGDASSAAVRIIADGGQLKYAVGTDTYNLFTEALEQDFTYHIEVNYVRDISFGNDRVDVYINGLCAGNLVPENSPSSINRFEFGGGYIENFNVTGR